MKSWKKPTDKQEIAVLKNLKGNLKSYFFSKLENPLWIESLNKKDLLKPSFIKDENGIERYQWDSLPYLIRISSHAPDEVYQVITPILEKRDNAESFLIHGVMQIGINFPNHKKEYTIKIANFFQKWLDESQAISCWLDIRELNRFLQNIKERGEEQIALKIIRGLLRLDVTVNQKKYSDEYTSKEIEVKTKFLLSQGMEKYYYEEILKHSKELFLERNSRYKLFECFYYILKTILNKEKDLDQKLCFHRSAVEEHDQDQYNNNPEYLIISSIRDISEILIQDNDSNLNNLFSKLELGNIKIFQRIILHLLRKHPERYRDKISKYLVSDLFDDTKLHHEYYLLLKQEFRNLTEEDQNKVLDFIDRGPLNTSWCEDENQKLSYTNHWKYTKLYCIKDDLPSIWKANLESLKKENSFEDPEHPDFLHYMSGGFVGNISPKEDDDLEAMSLLDIITYLTEWKPDGVFGSASKAGLADKIEKDLEKNSEKYLHELLFFKKVPEPIYIRHLFQGLSRVKNKSSDDWIKIFDIAEWSLTHENKISQDSLDNPFDDDKGWTWCHKELLRFLVNSLKDENELHQKVLINNSEKVFRIIRELVMRKDSYLESRNYDQDDDRYYTRAINSLHGEALSSLIEYALWLGRNKHKQESLMEIIPLLDKLLIQSNYLETWSILGRYIPWIHLIDSKWTKQNINKILPEDDRDKFESAWLTYINFVRPFDDVFPLLRDKYLYTLKTHLFSNSKDRDTDRRIAHHIAVYYIRGKIEIDDSIMSSLFEITENEKERVSLFSFLGRSIGVGNDNEKPSSEIIKKVTDLWDWRVNCIAGREGNYASELEQFVWLYKNQCFDRKWALENLYNIIVTNQITPKWSYIYEELANDIAIYPSKVWEIAKRLIFAEDFYYHSHKNLIKCCVKYIKDNGNDNLKKDKDDFINKIGEKFGAQIFDEITNY